MDFEIRQATEKDFPQVLDLLRESFNDRVNFLDASGEYHVAEHNKKIIGVMQVSRSEKSIPRGAVFLSSLAVRSDFRRAGAGRALFAHVLTSLHQEKKVGYAHVEDDLLPFYRKLSSELGVGFQVIERSGGVNKCRYV